jgi:hypothetical protein
MQRGRLNQEQMERIRDTVSELVQDLETHKDSPKTRPADEVEGPLAKLKQFEQSPPSVVSPSAQYRLEGTVLCIPGFGLLDEAAAIPLAQLLRREGLTAEEKQAKMLSGANLFSFDMKQAGLVCLCYLEHATPAQLQYASRRIRRLGPGAPVLIVVINEAPQPLEGDSLQLDAELLQGPLSAAVKRITEIMTRSPPDAAVVASPALENAG